MVARSKVVTAKWGVPAKEPEDMPDFLSNEEIVDKMGGDPRGVFRVQVKKITVVKNKNKDDMLKITAEIAETDKAKKGFNGYAFWDQQNVTDQSAPFLKQFLRSIGATWKDFNEKTKMTPMTTTDPCEIHAIGPVNFAGSKKVFAMVSAKLDNYNGNERAIIGRWLPPKDDAGEEADEDEELEDDELDDELEESEDGDEELDEEGEDEEAELREELEALSLVNLRKRAKANDDDAITTGLKKPALIDMIVGQEIELEDEDDEDFEDEDEEDDGAEEELREELDALTLAELKRRAKANGETVAVLKPIKDKGKLVDMIVEQELAGDEEDDEEPPF
jgi:hypothetical protein